MIPNEILNALHKFPKPTLELPCLESSWGIPPLYNATGSCWKFLHHPIASQITVFHYCPDSRDQLYRRFKTDLVAMLSHNAVLRDFAISPTSFASSYSYPAMPTKFAESTFPRLTIFRLQNLSNLFTVGELSIWGEKGGWKDMAM